MLKNFTYNAGIIKIYDCIYLNIVLNRNNKFN